MSVRIAASCLCLLLLASCGEDPVSPPEPTADVAVDVVADVMADTTASDSSEPSDTAAPQDTGPADATIPPSWCESTCAGMAAGCPDAMEGSAEECVQECEANAEGDCATEWAALVACVPADIKWVCDGEGGVQPAEAICLDEVAAVGACAQGGDPCDPNPCLNEGVCSVGDDGAATCDCLEKYSGDLCETCNPTCEEGVCDSDDGCGGVCGCGDAETCVSGACIDAVQALCESTGGTWMDAACECAFGFEWDADKGCVEIPLPEGACSNDKDKTLYETTPPKTTEGVLFDCAIANMGKPAAALATCIQKTLAFSDDCALCFGEQVQCTLSKCMNDCMGGFGAACTKCTQDQCGPSFTACSGLLIASPVEPDPKETLCTNSGGTWANGTCKCPPNTKWDDTEGCKKDAVANPNEKKCADTGGAWANGTCKCPPGTTWDVNKGCAKDAPAGGACANPKDKGLYENTPDSVLEQAVTDCAMANMGKGPAVIGACLQKSIEFSDSCAFCFGEQVECTMSQCMMECMGGSGDACSNCTATKCGPAFEECSGLKLDSGGSGVDPKQTLCVETGGSWQNGNCKCPAGQSWDPAQGCKGAGPGPKEKLCTSTGGSWNGSDCKCPAETTWDDAAGCMKESESACTNDADMNVYATTPPETFENAKSDCAMANFGASASEIAKCLQKTVPLSDACALCFGADTKCVMTECMMDCMGQDAAKCDACAADKCTPAFEKCSGLTSGGDSSEGLCVATGGKWLLDTCGDWSCGKPPLCDAIIPGCDCGAGHSFDPMGLGCYADDACGAPPAKGTLIINEISYKGGSQFIELYNPTDDPVDLSDVTLVLGDGDKNSIYAEVSLAALVVPSGTYAVLTGAQFNGETPPGVPTLPLEVDIQEGPNDAVAIVKDIAGVNGPPVVWDALAYQGQFNPGDAVPWWQGEGDHPGQYSEEYSLQRCPNGQDNDANDSDFSEYPASPGEPNVCEAPALAPTYENEISQIFVEHCSPCHNGLKMGNHNIAEYFEDTQQAANHDLCIGMTVGECALELINEGIMPPPSEDATEVTESQKKLLEAWIEGGQKQF